MKSSTRKGFVLLGIAAAASAACSIAQACGLDVQGWLVAHGDIAAGASMMGAGTIEAVMKSVEKIESNLKAMSEKADGEMKTLGKVSEDTKTALDNLGKEQLKMAERLTQMEQKGELPGPEAKPDESWGAQVVKSESLKAFQGGSTQKARIEVKNTVVTSDTTVPPDRRPGVVGGAFQPLTILQLLPSLPTTQSAVEYTRENTFTNNAAETAEGASKPESAITFSLVNAPVSTVAHWIKISRQLARDNPALAAYINTRMRYGVDRKVEAQLVVGDGTAPNISGIMKSGNYTPHGYLSGSIGSTLPLLVLIRKIIADCWAAGFPADGILLNPADWAAVEISLLTTAAGQVPFKYDEAGTPRLWGVPVVQAIGMAADTVSVGAFGQAYTVYDREDTVVEMSESDSDNFTKNLITVRAERRLLLATERPAAVRGGDLTPPAS